MSSFPSIGQCAFFLTTILTETVKKNSQFVLKKFFSDYPVEFEEFEKNEELIDDLRKEIHAVFAEVYDVSLDMDMIQAFSSCTKNKISYHIFVTGYHVKNWKQVKAFYNRIPPTALNGKAHAKPYLDKSIYSKNRLIRLPFCTKINKQNEKKPMFVTPEDFDEMLVQLSPNQILHSVELIEIEDTGSAARPAKRKVPTPTTTKVSSTRGNLFTDALDAFNVDADENRFCADSDLALILDKLPNGGMGQGYPVRKLVMMACYRQESEGEPGKDAYMTWMKNKANPDMNGYEAEWNSFARHCESHGKYNIGLAYLQNFASAVRQKMGGGGSGSRRRVELEESHQTLPDEEPQLELESDDEMEVEPEEDSFESPCLNYPFNLSSLFDLLDTVAGDPTCIEDTAENREAAMDYINKHVAYVIKQEAYLFKSYSATGQVEYTFLKTLPCFGLGIRVRKIMMKKDMRTGEMREVHRKVSMKLGNWLADQTCKLRTYTSVTFHPGLPKEEADRMNTFNLFTGYKLMHELERRGGKEGFRFDQSKCQVFIDHIRDNVCFSKVAGESEKLFDLMIKTLAHALRHPDKPTQKLIVLLGHSGCGKGALMRLIRRLFNPYVKVCKGIDEAIDKHAEYGNAVWLLMDEAQEMSHISRSSSTHFQQVTLGSKLQSIITEETRFVNPKHIRPYEVVNCSYYLATLEMVHGIGIHPTDRRTHPFIFRYYHGMEEFFKIFEEALKNLICLLNFVYYLLYVVDLTGFDHLAVLDSSHRHVLIQEGARDMVRIFIEYVEHNAKKRRVQNVTETEWETYFPDQEDKTVFRQAPEQDIAGNYRLVTFDEFHAHYSDPVHRLSKRSSKDVSKVELAKGVASWLHLEMDRTAILVPENWYAWKELNLKGF